MNRIFNPVWRSDFFSRLKAALFPGTSYLTKGIPTLFAALSIWLGYKLPGAVTIILSTEETSLRTVNVGTVHLITGMIVSAFVVFSFGFAAAGAEAAEIWLPQQLELDDERNQSLRLEVRCIGKGVIKVKVSVTEVRDANGDTIESESVDGRPLRWAFFDHETKEVMELTEKGLKRSVTVFQYFDAHLHIYGLGGKTDSRVFALNNQSTPAFSRIYVKLSAEGCQVKYAAEGDRWNLRSSKWYAIERDDRLKTHYRPIGLPDSGHFFYT